MHYSPEVQHGKSFVAAARSKKLINDMREGNMFQPEHNQPCCNAQLRCLDTHICGRSHDAANGTQTAAVCVRRPQYLLLASCCEPLPSISQAQYNFPASRAFGDQQTAGAALPQQRWCCWRHTHSTSYGGSQRDTTAWPSLPFT